MGALIASIISAAVTQKEFWQVILQTMKLFKGHPDKKKVVRTLKRKVDETKKECTGVACATETKGI